MPATLPLGTLPGEAPGVAAKCVDFLPGSPANLLDPGRIFHTSVAVRQFLADARCASSIRQCVDRPAQRGDGLASWVRPLAHWPLASEDRPPGNQHGRNDSANQYPVEMMR